MKVRKIRHDLAHGFETNVSRSILVGQNSWKKSDKKVLGLDWEPSSVVVAVHDPKQRVGYFGQFTLFGDITKRTSFRNMMRAIREGDHDPILEAWVSGAPTISYTDDERERYGFTKLDEYRFNFEIDKNRMDTVRHLGWLGVSRVDNSWLQPNEVMVGSAFNPMSGDLVYAVDMIETEIDFLD